MHSQIVDPKLSPTYLQISERMRLLGVPIERFIDESKPTPVRAYTHLLDGIEFDLRAPRPSSPLMVSLDRQGLLQMLDGATKNRRPCFRRGKVKKRPHISIDVSMLYTNGVGFREIYYFKKDADVNKKASLPQSLSMRKQGIDHGFSAQFGGGPKRIDISALHVSVGQTTCAIHVDEAGFVMQPMPGKSGHVSVGLDAVQHTFYELLLREFAGLSPDIEIYVPNAQNDYERAGIHTSFSIMQGWRLNLDTSIKVRRGPVNASWTVSLSKLWK